MRLYNCDGWANMPDIIESPTPFVLCIGGRGTGKTYGAIKYLLENRIKFLYLRRTSSQMELVSKEGFCPIVKIGADLGMALCTVSLGKYATAVHRINDEGNAMGEAVAYIMALSTISSARSIEASSVTCLLYDECVPELHEKQIKAESTAFLNCVETISRNRELQGKEPLKVVCLANANNMEAAILKALNCIKPLDQMKKKRQSYRVDNVTGLTIALLNDSPISAEKRQTALYKLTMNTGDFTDMALANNFSQDNYIDIANRSLAEYNPVASIGTITLYRHKNNYTWYVSETKSGSPEEFVNSLTERQRFRKKYFRAWEDYFDKKVLFENVSAKVFFKAVFLDNLVT